MAETPLPTTFWRGPQDDPIEVPFFAQEGFDSLGDTPIELNPNYEARVLHTYKEVVRREQMTRLPRLQESMEAWNLYNNRYDFNDKLEWQSQKCAPKVFTTVERLCSTIVRILERSHDWIQMESSDETRQVIMDMLKKRISNVLNSKDIKFQKQFKKMVKCGLLSQVIHVLCLVESEGADVYEETIEPVDSAESMGFLGLGGFNSLSNDKSKGTFKTPDKPKIRMEVINPDYLIMDDHTGGDLAKGGFKVLKIKLHKGRLLQMADKMGIDSTDLAGKMNSQSTPIDGVLGSNASREAMREDTLQNDHTDQQFAELSYFFGTLYDEDTYEVLVDMEYFIVLNDEYLVKPPTKIPFWHGGSPVISASLIEDCFAAEGRSPVVMNLDMFEVYNDFLNMMFDFFQGSLMGIREVDLDVLDDQDQDFRTGFAPGDVVFTRKQMNPAANAVKNIPFTEIDPGFWNFFQLFQKELSDNSLMADTLGGMPRTRGRITAMEDARRSSESGAVITSIFDGLEDNLLEPLVRHVMYCILQYDTADEWQEMVTRYAEHFKNQGMEMTPNQVAWSGTFDQVAAWTPEKRWSMLAGEYKCRVRIFSAFGDMQAQIEQMTFFIQSVAQIPGAMDILNLPEIFREYARRFGWAPDMVLKTEFLKPPTQMQPGPQAQPEGGKGVPSHASPGGNIPQPHGTFYRGEPTSISTSPPYAPGTGGPGAPP